LSRDTKWLPGHLQQVTCVRQLDLASSELFAQVGKDAAFASAAIIRRKIVGGLPSADGNLMGYFRLDFTTVTIVDVNWTADEDGVKETLQFVCQAAEVVYRQQSHTGEMAKIFPPGKWP
jgi:type VI protein secretion system component Hcp